MADNAAYRQLYGVALEQRFAREWCRVGYRGQGLSDFGGAPDPSSLPFLTKDMRALALGGGGQEDLVHDPEQVKPLVDNVRADNEWILRTFERNLGLGPEPILHQIAPGLEVPPTTTAAPQYDTGPISPAPDEVLSAAADETLRQVLAAPRNPHPAGTDEHAEFQAVLDGVPLPATETQEA